jgi:formylmethanofuran dehydrogenase subunit E
MKYIKYIKHLFGSLFTTNRKVDAATMRKYNKTGETVRTCNHCGKKKNKAKHFYKTTGNVCKKCHNKRTALYIKQRNA